MQLQNTKKSHQTQDTRKRE